MKIFILCLAFLFLSGCVSQSTYETLQDENDTLKTQNSILSQENLDLQEQISNLQLQLNTLQASYDRVSNPKEFRNVNDLKLWLAEDKTNELEYIEGVFDCKNFAKTLVNNALKDGYIIGIFSIDTTFPAPFLLGGRHAMNICFIDSVAYCIEPQTDETFIDTGSWDSQ